MRSIIAIGLLVVACLVVAVEVEAQSHLIIGTWQMNEDKSLSVIDNLERLLLSGYAGRSGCFQANPRYCSRVERFEEREDGSILYTEAIVSPDGYPEFSQAVFRLDDGEAYSYYGQDDLETFLATGSRTDLSLIWTQTDDYTIQAVLESDGQPDVDRTWTVSRDGTTMTVGPFVFDRVE